ncbi:MAG: hypothetical protein HY063_05940 [Bacteroidetes bacterium]|nr:hypothetical protein [Bacteroidota bacterium]
MENKINVGFTRRRKQKIYYGHYRNFNGGKFYPVIRVGGIFLRDFGFEISDCVEIIISQGKITISKVPKDYSPPADE